MLVRVTRQRLAPNFRLAYRQLSDKHRDIESFKRAKTEYTFGRSNGADTEGKSIDFSNLDDQGPNLRDHPSLSGMRVNSPEYKQQLYLLEQEAQGDQKKERARYEFIERIKAVGIGAFALVGIISTYQVVMNYKLIKTYFNAKWNHNWDDSFITDHNDPKENHHTISNLIERLNNEIDDEFLQGLKPSDTTPGIYLFGAIVNKKFPTRIPGFDSKYFVDVIVKNDKVVAVDDRGVVYHYSPEMKEPVKVNVPCKVTRVLFSGDKFYYLSNNWKDLYCSDTASSSGSSTWFGGLSVMKRISFSDFERGEKVKKISNGQDHLLVLTSKGRLFEINTAANPNNKGQFCLPIYAPSKNGEAIPTDVPYELKNLNYEVIGSGDDRSVQQRVFTDIGTGSYYNVVADSKKNVWSWGDNAFGQCGIEASTIGATQPVPRLVFSLSDLRRISKYSLPDKAAEGDFDIKQIKCSNETTLLKLSYNNTLDSTKNQDLLLSFGNGLKGQLGLSRYLHKIGQPLVIKSLLGMKEYDNVANKTINVGVKDVVSGGNHTFLILDNFGPKKDVLVFGENLSGQFGNGKAVKSSKPLNIPKLLEPADIEGSRKELARRVNDQTTNRFQLVNNDIKGVASEQVLTAGEDSSALYYRKR